jgi:hypothetical protein
VEQQGIHAAAYIAGIFGRTMIDGSGKDNISAMHNSSEAIYSLRPVTFRYKKRLIPKACRSLACWLSK